MCSSITEFVRANARSDSRHDNNDKAEDDHSGESQSATVLFAVENPAGREQDPMQLVHDAVYSVSTSARSDSMHDNNDKAEDDHSGESKAPQWCLQLKIQQDASSEHGGEQSVRSLLS